jgi:adenylate cyclase class 2
VLEREIKLLFGSASDAREAIAAIGATPLRARRLQDDVLFDTEAQSLGRRGCALRLRLERSGPGSPADAAVLTFKGPVQSSALKVREEHETAVADGDALAHVLEGLGFRPWFRYQKYREEFRAEEATIALDETPVGTFVEIEGSERSVLAIARALGRTPADFILDSYRALFLKRREQYGLRGNDLVFAAR